MAKRTYRKAQRALFYICTELIQKASRPVFRHRYGIEEPWQTVTGGNSALAEWRYDALE